MNSVPRGWRPIAVAMLAVAGVAACDNPTAPPQLTLNPKVASVDSSSCEFGYIVIQGVVTCR